MKLPFSKMSGTGNDFVVIDNRRLRIRGRARLARKLCDRHEGIGADGMLLVEPSRSFHYTMRYYNADGTDGGMCGNGARCIAWFSYVKRIAPARHDFEALRNKYEALVRAKERVSIGFPDPSAVQTAWVPAQPYPDLRGISFVDTGSPHAVVRLAKGKLEKFPVTPLGRSIRFDPSFAPHGTNVNFVEVLGPQDVGIRTYERGVEVETKACGTGSIACAITGAMLWGLVSPVRVHAPGGMLRVTFQSGEGRFTNVLLEGKARIVYEGSIHV